MGSMVTCPPPVRQRCFVIMPFGKKKFSTGVEVDFDSVYANLIGPAVERAGLEPLRADTEMFGGIIHTNMLEQILLCDYAVADMTMDNANVFWELGVRHGFWPTGTVLLRGNPPVPVSRVPFDLNFMKYLPYQLDEKGGLTGIEDTALKLTDLLLHTQENVVVDSPLYSLIQGIKPPEIDRRKTDTLRIRFTRKPEPFYRELDEAFKKKDKGEALAEFVGKYSVRTLDSSAQVAVFLSFREKSMWKDMVEFYCLMGACVRESVLAREQYALALNRFGGPESQESYEAERILLELLEQRGDSSETCALLGRIYKDRYDGALKAGRDEEALGYLEQAIESYLRGFEADPRDAYPGINTATLMFLMGEGELKKHRDLLPAVKWAARLRTTRKDSDYWDFATLIEAAVLDDDWDIIPPLVGKAMIKGPTPWMVESTINNLGLIREVRERRGLDAQKLNSLIERMGNLKK
ncbi:DUF4071 domain-containing protein [Deltaproteobacteria bacterium Smac51]|nr:DUF4071 domain-containing protein [Deltaproteobacteria bacterium Smac51]